MPCPALSPRPSNRRDAASPFKLRGPMRYSDFMKELAGGAVAAALTLPIGISLGIFTLEPLGPHPASLGGPAGAYDGATCSLLPVIFGSRAGIINVPRSVTAVFVAAMLLQASGV